MWTQGKPENPLNNHPITAGDIIGVHNGTVSNDDKLIRLAVEHGYTQQGEVDSEAIFATLDRVSDQFSLTNALELIEARMAIAWIDTTDTHDNTLHLARGDSSPLVLAQTHNGSLIFASTDTAIKGAADACGIDLPYMEHVKEGSYFRVRDGIVAETQQFIPTANWYYSGRTWTSPGTTKTSTPIVKTALEQEHTSSYIQMKYLDINTEVPEETPLVFKASNPARNKAVQEWLEDHAFIEDGEELTDGHAVFAKAAENGAFLRPGTWVQTHFKGEWCDAQVYRVPKTFPQGDYILRVLVPFWGEHDALSVEPVLLARGIHDIDGDALRFDTAGGEGDTGTDNKSDEPVAELTA